MGPYVTLGQCGSVIVCQRRNALRRQSSSHSGSFFLAEMIRTVSSESPAAIVSDSMSVSKPAWYSLLISDSIELLIGCCRSDVLVVQSRRCDSRFPIPDSRVAYTVLAAARATRDVLSPLHHRAEELREEPLFGDAHFRKLLGDRAKHAVVLA